MAYDNATPSLQMRVHRNMWELAHLTPRSSVRTCAKSAFLNKVSMDVNAQLGTLTKHYSSLLHPGSGRGGRDETKRARIHGRAMPQSRPFKAGTEMLHSTRRDAHNASPKKGGGRKHHARLQNTERGMPRAKFSRPLHRWHRGLLLAFSPHKGPLG